MRSKLKEVPVNSIGIVSESSFHQKWGTPRQGLLVPKAEAKITLECCLSDIRPNNRVAILWFAHLNGSKFNPLKARIRPPKLGDGKTVGVFATRGVHRPSSIGLSFCLVKDVTENVVTVVGADMIIGTPILAILPAPEFPDLITVRMPDWTQVSATRVSFGLGVLSGLNLRYSKNQVEAILEFVGKILSQDPRSIHSVRKHIDPIYEIDLVVDSGDKVWVVYTYREERIVVWSITKERIVEEFPGRTEPWLRRLKEKIPMIGFIS
jgi:tRNA (Thr-GGU) A37 N-methylase